MIISLRMRISYTSNCISQWISPKSFALLGSQPVLLNILKYDFSMRGCWKFLESAHFTKCGQMACSIITRVSVWKLEYFVGSCSVFTFYEAFCVLNYPPPLLSFSSQTKRRKSFATLTLFPWKIFWWVAALLVLSVQTFTAKARHDTHTGSYHPRSLRILLEKRSFLSHGSFPKIATLWN